MITHKQSLQANKFINSLLVADLATVNKTKEFLEKNSEEIDSFLFLYKSIKEEGTEVEEYICSVLQSAIYAEHFDKQIEKLLLQIIFIINFEDETEDDVLTNIKTFYHEFKIRSVTDLYRQK